MKITNNTNRDMSNLIKTLESFIPYTQERLGYDKPFKVFFKSDVENSKNIFGKTAYYDPATMNVHVYVDGRHDKDMLRSISHEIVHHHQNCRGDFDGAFEVGEGYAQKSPHLRNMEAEAYLLGNGFLVRDFEDSAKLGESILMEWKENKKQILKEEEHQKPDFLDLDKDGDKEEPMSKAAKDKELFMKMFLYMSKDAKDKDLEQYIDSKNKDLEQYIDSKAKDFKDYMDKKREFIKKATEPRKESVKNHYTKRSENINQELMRRWFKKGDK